MTAELIPNDIKQFILTSIDSVAQLEALLLLRANSQDKWTVTAVAKRLYLTESETAPLLASLCAQGLAECNAAESLDYTYQPQSADLIQIVDCVAELYAKHLVPVTNLIHAKPRTRIQEFADAFKLRKDE